MKVKTDFDGCQWLTAGKVYEAEQDKDDPDLVYITADNSRQAGCRISGCAHLNGNKWQVIEGVNEMATQIVKHEGKEYQIGKVYEFNYGGSWVIGTLSGVDSSGYPFDYNDDKYCSECCREINPEALGKITKAKIKPEAGKFYKISNGITVDYVMWGDSIKLLSGWGVECEMVEKND